MTRIVLTGAWYGDHLPSGAYAATVPNHGLLTHQGLIPWPQGEPWGIGYPRCTDIGGFRAAGQAHSTIEPACWEWNGAWRSYPQPCIGVSPTIYDRHGVLHRSDGSVGSQGYRYVNEANQIISGDATYGPFHGLFEYTALGDDLWIGQAAYDSGGVQVLQRTIEVTADFVVETWTLRQLEFGECRFVRANRDGETVALAFTRPEGVVLMLTTMAALRALPPVETPPEPVPPDPPDPEPPDPEPIPEPPDPTPEPPVPVPIPPEDTMPPFAAALRLGAHYFARVDPTPGLAPWPGWCVIKFDRTDEADPDCQWEVSKPDESSAKLRARHLTTGATLTMDFTEYGGNVCQGFYGSPESAGWYGYQQLSGWQLGPGGVEILTVDYVPAGTKAAAPCLTVVRR